MWTRPTHTSCAKDRWYNAGQFSKKPTCEGYWPIQQHGLALALSLGSLLRCSLHLGSDSGQVSLQSRNNSKAGTNMNEGE